MQAVLFLRSPQVSGVKFVKLVGRLGVWLAKLTGDPQILPQEGMPEELPVVVWMSESGEWECRVRRSRIDLVWRLVSRNTAPQSCELFFQDAANTLSALLDGLEGSVSRLAAVVQRFAGAGPQAAKYLSKHFCAPEMLREPDGPIKRTDNFEIASHKVFSMGPFRVNSWVRNKNAYVEPNDEEVIVVATDVNTIATQDIPVPREGIPDFFARAARESGAIVSLYYPESTCL